MSGGDLCKSSAPRVEVDQQVGDARLGLERIERLLAQRDAGSGKTAIFKRTNHLEAGMPSWLFLRRLEATPRTTLLATHLLENVEAPAHSGAC
jgi:hypothetical protein